MALTQRQLAGAVGREQKFIDRIESGQQWVDSVEFVIICRACGAEAGSETASLVKKLGEMLPSRGKRG